MPGSNYDRDLSVKEGFEIRPAVFELCAKNNWPIYQLTPQYNSLEDVFKILTTADADEKSEPGDSADNSSAKA